MGPRDLKDRLTSLGLSGEKTITIPGIDAIHTIYLFGEMKIIIPGIVIVYIIPGIDAIHTILECMAPIPGMQTKCIKK